MVKGVSYFHCVKYSPRETRTFLPDGCSCCVRPLCLPPKFQGRKKNLQVLFNILILFVTEKCLGKFSRSSPIVILLYACKLAFLPSSTCVEARKAYSHVHKRIIIMPAIY